MKIFICLDDNNGMMFNGRRQSRDEAVVKDILDFAGEEKVWVSSYSSKLFHTNQERILIEDNISKDTLIHGYFFIENVPLKLYEDSIENLIVYCWNRVYPADVYLDINLNTDWEMIDTKEFGGKSHEKITRKIYRRKM
jgi:hypothetical protein